MYSIKNTILLPRTQLYCSSDIKMYNDKIKKITTLLPFNKRPLIGEDNPNYCQYFYQSLNL